ncbi:MAG: hypothetical protein F6K42_24320 [Leptolyngbya sp. SIO1D8]|nr:hypothetical protein [Leptolyngbya sp. SIO1D8]
MLDGLDEVPTHNLNRVIEHIEDFVDTYYKNTFVASCRIAAYRSSQSISFKRFTDVTLAEFDDEQIEQFICRWFRSGRDQEAGTANQYWELLQKDENKATKELAQTPLLLTFLCLVYDREQTLPTQRSTLYGKALNILLAEWAAQKRLDQDPIYEGFHPDLEKVLLAEIAYTSFEQDQLFFLKDDITQRISEFLADTLDAPKYLDGAAVLKTIERQQGILVERATDIYSFSHLTLQEYLTAFHIKKEQLDDLLIAQHLTDGHWREVFLLVAGLRGNKVIDLLAAIEEMSRIYLAKYPKLLNLVRWAEMSITGSQGKYKPAAKRAVAIAGAMDGEMSINPARARQRVRAIHIAKSLDIDIDIDMINTIAVAKSRARRRSLDAIDNEITRKRAVSAYINISKAITEVIDSDGSDVFVNPSFRKLPIQLKRLAELIPSHVSSKDWRHWADEFEALWLDTLGLEKAAITFTQTEAEALRNYLYTIDLLIRCKDAVVRIPKQAWTDLESRLLTV